MLKTLPKPSVLILLVPLCIYWDRIHFNPSILFVVTAISIYGLISLMSKSTDQLSLSTGPVIGGLLNASFGNFPELLIGINAINTGLVVLVKASMVGSILGNILLTMGAAMFFGGLAFGTQKFSRTGTSASVLMLSLTVVALLIPSFVHQAFRAERLETAATAAVVSKISLAAGFILLAVYLVYLWFSLRSNAKEFSPAVEHTEKPEWKVPFATAMLLVAAAGVAFQSDIFVDSIQGMLKQSSIFSERFMGVIFVAAIGNAVGLGVAVNMARKNKMELAFGVSMGASIQVSLLIVPLLVLYSFFVGKPLTLDFGGLEIISLWAALTITSNSILDGTSNWFEGIMYVSVYILLATAFFFMP